LTAYLAEIQKNTTDSIFGTPWGSYIPKIAFLGFLQKNPFDKTSQKSHISAPSTGLLASNG
jgi:hypothetical protein